MLTQIRNAQAVEKETVSVPFSRLKFELAKILVKEGYLGAAVKRGKKLKKTLEMTLHYHPAEPGEKKQPMIGGLRRVSKSSRRVYVPCDEIKPIKQGMGIGVISTSKGLLTTREAKKARLGGEFICEVW